MENRIGEISRIPIRNPHLVELGFDGDSTVRIGAVYRMNIVASPHEREYFQIVEMFSQGHGTNVQESLADESL